MNAIVKEVASFNEVDSIGDMVRSMAVSGGWLAGWTTLFILMAFL